MEANPLDYAEIQLVQLSRTGDRAAFIELVNLYKGKLQRLAYRMLNNKHDSEDAVQETLLRVYQNLDHYDESQTFSTWIYRIGKNICIDLLRKKKFTHSLDAGVDAQAEQTYYDKLHSKELSPESTYLYTEMQEQIRKLINKLSVKYRTIVALYYLNDLTLQEISEQLGIPVTTVKSRLHRGREQLRRKWGVTLFVNMIMFYCGLLV
jgi:RNA polymerase sigma-70 factor (ECF subfamily)